MVDNSQPGYPNLYPLDPCADIEWQGGWVDNTIEAIAANFNLARSQDSTVTGPDMDISAKFTQAEWDALDFQKKGLWLLNSEREARGIAKFSAIVPELVTISQDFAQYLADTGTFGHNVAVADWTSSFRDPACDVDGDGQVSPYDRIKCVPKLKDNTEFWAFAENLAMTSASSAAEMNEPMAWSIYSWIYDDSSSSWGHRHFCLSATAENNGADNDEGLVGFGEIQGSTGTFVVMNAADESATWQHPAWDTLQTSDLPTPN